MNDDATSTSKKSLFRRLIPLFVLAGVAALVFVMGWHKFLSIESLATNRAALQGYVSGNFALALAGFGLLYAGVVALSLPVASFLTIFGGFLFGGLAGGGATVLGATAGALVIFLIARTSLGETLAERAGPWLEKLRDGFKEHALNYMLFLRLVPLFPFWLVNIAPALLGVRTSTFALGTFLGIIPGTMAFSFVGAGLDSVIEAQANVFQTCQEKFPTHWQEMCEFKLDTSALITPELLVAFAALGVVALIPVVLQKLKSRKSA